MNRREFMAVAGAAALTPALAVGAEAVKLPERNWFADELNKAHLKASLSAGPMGMQALWRNMQSGCRECSQVTYAYIGFDLNDGTEEVDPNLLHSWLSAGEQRPLANPFIVRWAEVTDKMIKRYKLDRPLTEFHDDGTFTFVVFADGEKDEKGRVGRAAWDFKTERWV